MVEKTYKAIGVDLDETLLDTEKRISATNRACIGQAREHNCRIICMLLGGHRPLCEDISMSWGRGTRRMSTLR